MKWIHYTEQGNYFKLDKFQVAFNDAYPIPISKLKDGEIGKLNEHRIIVKKMTKKEIKYELNKEIKGIYNFLKEHKIPFHMTYIETKKKIMIGRFLRVEMWIKK